MSKNNFGISLLVPLVFNDRNLITNNCIENVLAVSFTNVHTRINSSPFPKRQRSSSYNNVFYNIFSLFKLITNRMLLSNLPKPRDKLLNFAIEFKKLRLIFQNGIIHLIFSMPKQSTECIITSGRPNHY